MAPSAPTTRSTGRLRPAPAEEGRGLESSIDVWQALANTLKLLDRRLDALLPEAPSATEHADLLRLRTLAADTLQRLHQFAASLDGRSGPGGDAEALLRHVAKTFAETTGLAVDVRVGHRSRLVPATVAAALAHVADHALAVVERVGQGGAVEVKLEVASHRAVLEVRETVSTPQGTGLGRDVSGNPDVARMAHVLRSLGGRVVLRSGGARDIRIRAIVPLGDEWLPRGGLP